MPCRGPELGDFVKPVSDVTRKIHSELSTFEMDVTDYISSRIKESENLTKWLCAILEKYEQGDSFEEAIAECYQANPHFNKWWEDHKELDKKRDNKAKLIQKRKEAIKKALSKLTEEEKELLGHK